MPSNNPMPNHIHNLRGGRRPLTRDSLDSSGEAISHHDDVVIAIYPSIAIEVDGDHVPRAFAVLNTLSTASMALVAFAPSAHMAAPYECPSTGS